MKRNSNIIHKLGTGLRERIDLLSAPTPEMQVLLLRLALQELQRRHYCASGRSGEAVNAAPGCAGRRYERF
jgi:hypothetical protein